MSDQQQQTPRNKPGKYRAKAADWGISKTQAGLPQVVVLFDYMEPAEGSAPAVPRQLLWWGSFKDKAQERTLKTLLLLGLKGDLPSLADGRPGKALDIAKEVEIVVEHSPDMKGTLRARIAWVNSVDGGMASQERLTKEQASAELAQFSGALMALRAESGQATAAPSGGKQTLADQLHGQQPMLSESDIPF